ncbi:MAG: HAD family hydrolase [Candidatus Eremiobacteraeota bacterium]|nr:HAD family hydrolase [Candidatus Eremiobacteraeota bacterium]
MSALRNAVLLDVDGTLLDSNDAHAETWSRALRQAGYDVPFARLRPLIGMGGDRILREVAGLDHKSAAGKSIAKCRTEMFLSEYLPRLAPTPGARALVEVLRARGLKIVVATSASEEELGALLRAAGVADLIEAASKKDDAKTSKPAPDIVEAALQKAGVPPERAFMIGDTPYDCEAARRARVTIVAVRCGGWSDERLDAAAVYDDPADLLAHLDRSPAARLLATGAAAS